MENICDISVEITNLLLKKHIPKEIIKMILCLCFDRDIQLYRNFKKTMKKYYVDISNCSSRFIHDCTLICDQCYNEITIPMSDKSGYWDYETKCKTCYPTGNIDDSDSSSSICSDIEEMEDRESLNDSNNYKNETKSYSF